MLLGSASFVINTLIGSYFVELGTFVLLGIPRKKKNCRVPQTTHEVIVISSGLGM